MRIEGQAYKMGGAVLQKGKKVKNSPNQSKYNNTKVRKSNMNIRNRKR